jgi:hypothetical protein
VILWFSLELLGALIGASSGGEGGAYLYALLFAGIGGLVSYLVARSGAPVVETPQTGEAASSEASSQVS